MRRKPTNAAPVTILRITIQSISSDTVAYLRRASEVSFRQRTILNHNRVERWPLPEGSLEEQGGDQTLDAFAKANDRRDFV